MSPKQKATKASKSHPKPIRRHSESDKPARIRKERKEGDKIHRRSRNGCYTCRLRRKKCDEAYPLCRGCEHLGLDCEYHKPSWWDLSDQRAQRKEDIKEHIKTFKPIPTQTKPKQPQQPSHVTPTPPFTNTPPSLCHSVPAVSDAMFDPIVHASGPSPLSQFSPQFNLDTPRELYYSTPMMAPPQWTPAPTQFPYFSPFEVDIKTERQIFVNDIPTRKDSTVSTFTSLQPPTPTVTLPSCPPEAWMQHERHEMKSESFVVEDSMDHSFFEFPHDPLEPSHQAVIEVDDCDRSLLEHFLENVAPMTFSILDVTQKGSVLSDVVLPQLEQNKAYLHCCLSASALHLKITEQIHGDKIDNDIMRHRGAAIQELCTALQEESEHSRLLEVTLAMILFQSSVGSPSDDLPDIPWHQHFHAATDLLDRVGYQSPSSMGGSHYGHASFNSSLAAWIDILGGTMLKKVPVYSNAYREKHEASVISGLAQLMGCDDSVMYLISEIACLDAVKESTIKDDLTLCQYITDLGGRLSATEGPNDEVGSVFSPYTGAIKPEQLRINITAVFRYAARIYLCSLVPAFDKTSDSVKSLIDTLTNAMSFIPMGERGFDRALVWPLLISGAFSVETSSFRGMFESRTHQLGASAECGSWSRLNKLLQEVWSVNDQLTSKGGTYNIHWRDVMAQNSWDFLLI